LAASNGAYLSALHEHLQRHPSAQLLAEHYPAVQATAETLVQLRWQAQHQADAHTYAVSGIGLRRAVTLATQQKDGVNAIRWESEACELERLAEAAGAPPTPGPINLADWTGETGWQLRPDRPWSFADPLAGVALAGDAVWTACGLQRRSDKLWVYPKRDNPWRWWALLELPLDAGPTASRVSLVWDGKTLYATQPVESEQPVQLCTRIRALHTDELDFNLQFELTHAAENGTEPVRRLFHPTFDHA
jgi:hypothetical protein